MKRRSFLKTAGLTSLVSLSPIAAAELEDSSFNNFSDFKGIIVINLAGGNDAMGTFPPTDEAVHSEYYAARGGDNGIGTKNIDLSDKLNTMLDENGYYAPRDGEQAYAVEGTQSREALYRQGSYHLKTTKGKPTGLSINALMPEMAALYNKRKLSVISNVGNLLTPLTREEYDVLNPKTPPLLFSHFHQTKFIQALDHTQKASTGWAGRLADLWGNNGTLGQNISTTGRVPLFGSLYSPSKLINGSKTNFKHASFHDAITAVPESNNFLRVYKKRRTDLQKDINTVNGLWDAAPDFSTFKAKNSYGGELFTTDAGSIGFKDGTEFGDKFVTSLKDAVKVLKIAKDSGSKRQILHVNESKFDTHANQIEIHSMQMRNLSTSISDTYKALEEMNMHKKVVIVVISEFGRTTVTNHSGTDHGWGQHLMMISGTKKFKGHRVCGKKIRDLSASSPDVVSSRRRLLPSTSMEQLLAPMLDWFGVREDEMPIVLPYLTNFRTGDSLQSAYVPKLFKSVELL